MDINFTAHETTVINALATGGYFGFFDDGIQANSTSWTDVFTDEAAGVLGLSAKAAGGVLSSLIKKGLFETDGEEGLYMTQAGADAVLALRK